MEGLKTLKNMFVLNESKGRQGHTDKQNLSFKKLYDEIQEKKTKKQQQLNNKVAEYKILRSSNKKHNLTYRNEDYLQLKSQILTQQAQNDKLHDKIKSLKNEFQFQKMLNQQVENEHALIENNKQEILNAKYQTLRQLEYTQTKVADLEKLIAKEKKQQQEKLKQIYEKNEQLQTYFTKIQEAQQRNLFVQKNNFNQFVQRQVLLQQKCHQESYTKHQIKSILKLLMEIDNFRRQYYGEQALHRYDILSKLETRIHNKSEIVRQFEKQYGVIDENLSNSIIKFHQELKQKLDKMETKFTLLEQERNQLKLTYSHICALNNDSGEERQINQKYYLQEQELQRWQNEKVENQKKILIFNEFMVFLLDKIFKICRTTEDICNQSRILKSYDPYIKQLNQDYYSFTVIQNYKQISKINQQFTILQKSSPGLRKYFQSENIIRIFYRYKQIQSQFVNLNITHDILQQQYLRILSNAYNLQKQFIISTKTYYSELVVYLKKKCEKLRYIYKENYQLDHTYCVQSPEYYRVDNLKLLEQLQKKQKKHVSKVDKDLIEQMKNINTMREAQQKKIISKNINYFFRRFYDQNLVHTVNKTQNNCFDNNDRTTFTFQRKRKNSKNYMKIRNMLNTVKKLATPSARSHSKKLLTQSSTQRNMGLKNSNSQYLLNLF